MLRVTTAHHHTETKPNRLDLLLISSWHLFLSSLPSASQRTADMIMAMKTVALILFGLAHFAMAPAPASTTNNDDNGHLDHQHRHLLSHTSGHTGGDRW